MADVAAILREARANADLSQAEVAARADTSQPALARYETGASLPTLPTLERLLSACGQRLQVRALRADGPATRVMSMRGRLGPQARELRRRRGRLLDVAHAHGVGKLRVFGSLARGQAGHTSDVDLLVDLKPDRTLLDLAAFRREAAKILDMPVDVATEDMLKERIRDDVLAEALPL